MQSTTILPIKDPNRCFKLFVFFKNQVQLFLTQKPISRVTFNIYSGLMVNMTEIPCLVDLAKSIQYFITQSIKLYTFTNQCWFARVRQLQTTLKHFHRSQPPMEVCLKCSQNMRHQQIKQARFNMANLIDDPYLFYQTQATNKDSMYQEIGQKSLQDKLSELASGVQFGQICMRQLIENLTAQGKELFSSKEFKPKQGELQFIPILKSLAKHVKAERKETFQIAVQTQLSEIGQKTSISAYNKSAQASPKQFDQKSRPKLANELSEKIKQIKNLQEKLLQQSKIISYYKNQINVLEEDQSTLQKRNSILQIQLNWSKSKPRQPKTKKGSYVGKISRNNSQISSNLQAIRQIAVIQESRSHKLAKEAKIDKLNKSEFSSSVMKRSVNMASISNSYSQAAQRAFLKTENMFNYDKESDQLNQRKQEKQQDIQALHGQFPRLISSNMHVGSKQNQRKDQIYDFNSLNASILDIGKENEQNRLKMSKLKSEIPFISSKSKIRRHGTVYDKQCLLKMLHQNEVKNNRSSFEFQQFKNTYQNLIQKMIEIQQKNTKQNNFSMEMSRPQSRHLKLTRHLQKKSTRPIKTNLRNQLISRDQNQPKGQAENAETTQQSVKFQKAQKLTKDQVPIQILTQQQRKIISQLKVILDKVDNSQVKEHKRIVLNKKEQNIITEIMAYFVQLKVQNKLVYEEVRRIIASSVKFSKGLHDNQDKEAIRTNITQIINTHRSCPRLHANNFCSHLKHLVTSITKLLES